MSNYIFVNGELCDADALAHHGVKGMKWGVRRFQKNDGSLTPAGKRRYAKDEYKKAENKAFARYEKDIASIEKNYKRGQNLSKKDQARENAVEKRYQDASANAKAAYKQAKAQIKSEVKAEKAAIKETARKLNEKASFGEKLMFNDATRTKAASYIVKNNMTVEEATKKAKSVALRNTAIFVAAYAGVAIASSKI